MPKYTLTTLGVSCGILLVGYVACIATAVFFATLQTELSAKVEAAEIKVGALETKYYDAIATLSATNITDIGYVTPKNVAYVARERSASVTRADR